MVIRTPPFILELTTFCSDIMGRMKMIDYYDRLLSVLVHTRTPTVTWCGVDRTLECLSAERSPPKCYLIFGFFKVNKSARSYLTDSKGYLQELLQFFKMYFKIKAYCGLLLRLIIMSIQQKFDAWKSTNWKATYRSVRFDIIACGKILKFSAN